MPDLFPHGQELARIARQRNRWIQNVLRPNVVYSRSDKDSERAT
jgi:hypothetical protein